MEQLRSFQSDAIIAQNLPKPRWDSSFFAPGKMLGSWRVVENMIQARVLFFSPCDDKRSKAKYEFCQPFSYLRPVPGRVCEGIYVLTMIKKFGSYKNRSEGTFFSI